MSNFLINGQNKQVSIRFHPPKPPWPRKTEIEFQLVTDESTDDSPNLYGHRTELPRMI